MKSEPMVETITSRFARDVNMGLSSYPKKLSSKYFYDAKGDELFLEIMKMDEYYLTRAEKNIFEKGKEQIRAQIDDGGPFRIVELGAGDGMKTKVLLKYFQELGLKYSFSPVDISSNVLNLLEENLRIELPELKVEPIVGDYLQVLADLKLRESRPLTVFFLGSNIGNFIEPALSTFLTRLHDNLKRGDHVMIGFDLKKDPAIILNAYNDSRGITKAFNLNLLDRINRELGGDFHKETFIHYPVYDPMTGECRSYLVSTIDQVVVIQELQETFEFHQWETIFMEVSKKYCVSEIEELAHKNGFEVTGNLFDEEKLFCESFWRIK